MFRASRIRRKFFVFSIFITALLLVWNGINKNLSNTQAVFANDARVRKVTAEGNWQESHTREINPAAPSRMKKKNMEKIDTVAKYPNDYVPRNDYVKSREKGIRTEYEDTNDDKLRKALKISTESTFNRHSTKSSLLENNISFPFGNTGNAKPATTMPSSDFKPTLSTTNPHSSKQTAEITKRPVRKSVYGGPGCPDNPWREDLSELLSAWSSISKQNQIEYVLAYGSLLGAMRDGDVIPYDSDIDILLDINYFSIMKRLSVRRNFNSADGKIRLVVQPEFSLNIRVDERKRFDCNGKKVEIMVDGCSFQEPMARLLKGNLHIDVFHFYDRVHTVEDPSDDRHKEYEKKHFYPFQSCNFMGIEASCPNNPWEILRIYFNTDDLEPIYKCKDGSWVNKQGLPAVDVF